MEALSTAGEAPLRSVDLFGVRVDDVTLDEASALVQQLITDGAANIVTTPNPEIVMAARRNAALRDALRGTALNIPDGIGLLIAARWLGSPLREHVRGTDLVLRLAAEGATRRQRWFLLGADEGVAERAGAWLAETYPGLVIAGTYAGSPRSQDDEVTIARVCEAAPVQVILVAYGAPAQELWLARNLARTGVPVGIGVGGVFNFLSGRVPRAPEWMRARELEWLHRLLIQPGRWRRQLALPAFGLLAIASAGRKRLGERRVVCGVVRKSR